MLSWNVAVSQFPHGGDVLSAVSLWLYQIFPVTQQGVEFTQIIYVDLMSATGYKLNANSVMCILSGHSWATLGKIRAHKHTRKCSCVLTFLIWHLYLPVPAHTLVRDSVVRLNICCSGHLVYFPYTLLYAFVFRFYTPSRPFIFLSRPAWCFQWLLGCSSI